MVLIRTAQVNHSGSVTQMNVVQETETFKDLNGAVHRRRIDRLARNDLGSVVEFGSSQMVIMGSGYDLADRSPGGGNPESFGPQDCNQVLGGYVHLAIQVLAHGNDSLQHVPGRSRIYRRFSKRNCFANRRHPARGSNSSRGV